MNAIDLENKDTTLMPISRTFGFTNMYTDLKAAKQNFLEHELSKLEGGAAEILTRVKEAFVSMRPSVTITQGERNTLRRFLFIMKYRNDSFRSRFFCTLDEYSADDKEELGAYMQKMGLKEPVDVWYHNMRAFLAVEMDVHGDWVHKICSMAYPPDAMWFWAHVQGTFLAFCTTKQVGDEFFLTENVYGIFEGPNSVVMDLTTGNRHCTAYTEFHTFAPLSPQIMMILRSNLLPLPEKTLVGEEAELLEIQKACHINPDSAVSSLEDLPVTKALAFYAKLVNGRVANRQEAGPVPYSRKDTFEFSFFPCSHEHVQKINLVCLHEAKKTIIFRSPLAAKVALQYYLVHSPEKPTAISPAHTLSHLRTLETVLSKLGGRVPTAYRDWMHPVQRELRSYFALGKTLFWQCAS